MASQVGKILVYIDKTLDYRDQLAMCLWDNFRVESDWHTATAALRLSASLVDGVQTGLVERGFDDVRPVHGFAFAALAPGDTTTSGLAAALGVTKQAAARLVDYLVMHQYVTRVPDPHDRRAQLVVLTERGRACTAAAEQAAADVVNEWRNRLSSASFDAFTSALTSLAEPGRLRPSW